MNTQPRNYEEALVALKECQGERDDMRKVAQESQGWDWLAAEDFALENGYYEIPDMQELSEMAFNQK